MKVPRQPDPNSKTQQLYFRATTVEEKNKVKAVKELCARNDDIEIKDVLMIGVDKFLRDHNWPPGNSQTVLSVYGALPKHVCSRCGEKFTKLQRVKFVSGSTGQLCPGCLEHEEARTVIKKRMGLIQ